MVQDKHILTMED